MQDACIVSGNRFQSELLALFLNAEAGVSCCIASPVSPDLLVNPSCKPVMILIDGDSVPGSDVKTIAATWTASFKQPYITLFNAEKDLRIELTALESGFRGVFFRDIEPEMLTKGIKKILTGELWFTRKCLTAYMSEHDMKPPFQPESDKTALHPVLTHREIHILRQIATGHSATQIANDLCISPHTVKTHTRNLYKKIQVTNRFEAIRWLNRNS